MRLPTFLPAAFIFCLSHWGYGAIETGAAMPIDLRVQIQLIQTFTSNGATSAATLGNSSQRSYIETQVDKVWAQAGVDIQFFSTINLYKDSFAFDDRPNNHAAGSGNSRASGDLTKIINAGNLAGVGSSDPRVIDLYFVDIVPGWEAKGDFSTNGWAYIDGGGIALYVGDGMLTTSYNMDIVAGVLSHEIGHNLGLEHLSDPTNLMNPTVYQGNLTASQIASVRNNDSILLQPIPEPSIVALGIMGLTLILITTYPHRLRRQHQPLGNRGTLSLPSTRLPSIPAATFV